MSSCVSSTLTLQQITSICVSLGSSNKFLLDKNSVSLIIKKDGGAKFTKKYLKVIAQSEECSHPIEKLIINSLNKCVLQGGGDCKIYLSLLGEIMLGIEALADKLGETCARRTMLEEIHSLRVIIPTLFEEVKKMCARVTCSRSVLSDLRCITLTFFECTFSPCVARQLSELIYQFLSKSISDWNLATEFLIYVTSRFDLFCSKSISSLAESRVNEGIFFVRRPGPLPTRKDFSFVIIYDLSRKTVGTSWKTVNDSLQDQMYNLWRTVEELLDCLQRHGVYAILSSSVACEDFKAFCFKRDIFLLDGLALDEIENVSYWTGVFPTADLHCNFESLNTGTIRRISAVKNTNYIQVEMCKKIECFNLHHLLLCAPLDVLWNEYYEESYSCLKTVLSWLNPRKGESCFATEKLSRQECDLFRTRCLGSDSSIANYPLDSKNCLSGIAFPLHLYEFAFHQALRRHCAKNRLFSVLDFAFLQVICKTWNIPFRNFLGERSYTKVYQSFKTMQRMCPIEPVSLKEDQICSVLQVVQHLLRIDGIVSVTHM